jgi:hypothetical protein
MAQLVFDDRLPASSRPCTAPATCCAGGGWSARPSPARPASGSWTSAAAPASMWPSCWRRWGRPGGWSASTPAPDPRPGPAAHRRRRQRPALPGGRHRPARPRRQLRRRPVGAGAGVRGRRGRSPGRAAPGPAPGRSPGRLGHRLVDGVLALGRPRPHAPGAARLGRHLADPCLPRTLAPRLRAAGFADVRAEGHSFASIEFTPDAYGAAIVPLVQEYVNGR